MMQRYKKKLKIVYQFSILPEVRCYVVQRAGSYAVEALVCGAALQRSKVRQVWAELDVVEVGE